MIALNFYHRKYLFNNSFFILCCYSLSQIVLLFSQGLILRKEGKIQDSLDCFQAAYNVNSMNVDNIKQIAKSL